VPLASPATHLAVGNSSACAALADGTLWCWGDDRQSELGDGGITGQLAPVLAQSPCD
jgi:alpha-tubulin suppressor-like RCC1 family protein